MKKIHWLSVGVALVGAAAACSNTADPQARSTDTSNLGTAPSGREDGGREPVTPPPVVQSLAQTNIVASDPSVGGTSSTTVIDPTLVNAWGLAFNPRGAAWISANGSGIANAYDPTGRTLLTVTIPAPTRGQSAPTGQVFNQDAADFSGDSFLFSTEDGTIAGWQTSLGGTAALRVDNSASGAVYKGLAIVNTTDLHAGRLYATNFHAGTVDVWDTNYAPVATTGGFTDPNLPSGFAPFNVAVIERDFVLVTYALQNAEAHDDVAGPGNGFVNVFDLDGRLMTRLISQGELNSPWGLAQPPETFGNLVDTLLVGNFGDGRILAYDIRGLDDDADDDVGRARDTGDRGRDSGAPMRDGGMRPSPDIRAELLGVVGDARGNPIVIDGLWALQFGAGNGFDPNTLYFTAGPAGESQGVFGSLALP